MLRKFVKTLCLMEKCAYVVYDWSLSIFESNGYKEAFKFDHVLPDDVSQSEVFTRVFDNPRTSFIDLILDGFDLFVIGYGGSGCGKTFTLFGPNSLSEPPEIK
jgi:hypothetical protein